MTGPKPDPKPPTLLKHNSWSPDSIREEVWLRRKRHQVRRRSRSLTDEDFDELKACIELGFGFDSPELESDQRLSDTLPALGFYVAVNKSYNDVVSRLSSVSSSSSSLGTTLSESDLSSLASPLGSPLTMFTPGEDPKTIKTRLRQWAQAVACSLKQS
ncbi:hypothetical protein RND81_06G033100 [Saponaria officinalis]|uniref:Uncharacterized protein n=1 Tax=Saponaria officinalis TaxID=3572 RepID=A0AAW1K625_SAPOF